MTNVLMPNVPGVILREPERAKKPAGKRKEKKR
jgi:hypothetical protein